MKMCHKKLPVSFEFLLELNETFDAQLVHQSLLCVVLRSAVSMKVPSCITDGGAL